MTVTIDRDPFARSDLVRELVPKRERRECGWCGIREGRFRYGWDEDTLYTRPVFFSRPFCSVECYRAHHDIPGPGRRF